MGWKVSPVPGVSDFAHGWAKNATMGWLAHNGSVGYGSSYIMRSTNQINVAVVCNTANAGFCQTLAGSIYNQMVNNTNVPGSIPQFYDLFPSELQVKWDREISPGPHACHFVFNLRFPGGRPCR